MDAIINLLKKAIKDNNSKKFADGINRFFEVYDPRDPDHDEYWPWLIGTATDLIFREKYSLFKHNKEWNLDVHILSALEEERIEEEFSNLKKAVNDYIERYENSKINELKSLAKTDKSIKKMLDNVPAGFLEDLIAIRSGLTDSIMEFGALIYTEYESYNPKAFSYGVLKKEYYKEIVNRSTAQLKIIVKLFNGINILEPGNSLNKRGKKGELKISVYKKLSAFDIIKKQDHLLSKYTGADFCRWLGLSYKTWNDWKNKHLNEISKWQNNFTQPELNDYKKEFLNFTKSGFQ